MEAREKRQATLDTILKRNNSIAAVRKHAIPYNNLHKKTYFNALEMILNSPRNIKKSDEKSRTIGEATTKVFEDMFKHPPSRLDSEFIKQGKLKPATITSPVSASLKAQGNSGLLNAGEN